MEYLKKLRKFVENPYVEENYEELLKEAVKQICQIKLEGKSARNSRTPTPKSSGNNLRAAFLQGQDVEQLVFKRFLEAARECRNSNEPNWDKLQEIAVELFKEVKDEKNNVNDRNQWWKLLTPWQDTFIIADAILFRNDKLGDILEAIKREQISPVNSEDEEDNPEKKKTHAEMKIISRLYKKQQIEGETQEIKEKDLKPLLYIGSAKKTCAKCQAVIDKFDNDRYRWDVYGTHGSNKHRNGSDNKWKKPSIINKYKKEVEVEEIAINMFEKLFKESPPINHTTSEVAENLSNPVELLRGLELVAKIKVCPKTITYLIPN
jgi:hypothetical protein